MISDFEGLPTEQNAGVFRQNRKPKNRKTSDEAKILHRVQLWGRPPPPPPKNDQFSMISFFSGRSKGRNAGVLHRPRKTPKPKCPVGLRADSERREIDADRAPTLQFGLNIPGPDI